MQPFWPILNFNINNCYINVWLIKPKTDITNFLKLYSKNKDIIIYKNENDKPYIKNEQIFFNKSHSQNLCLLAVSNLEIGIDIEIIKERKFAEKIAKEYGFLHENFYQGFSLRESFIKSFGGSLGKNLPKISVLKINNNEFILGYDKKYTHKAISYFWPKGYIFSLCWPWVI